MKFLIILAGAIVGLFFVRLLLLSPVEELAWSFFWHDFFQGKIRSDSIGHLLNSTTFLKCSSGFLIARICAGVSRPVVVGVGPPPPPAGGGFFIRDI